MKKGFRGILIASAILFSVGLALCIVSLVAGVDFKHVRIGKKYHGEVEDINQTFTQTITSLDLQICSGNILVKRGDQFKLEGTGIPKGTIKYSVEDGVLKIKDELDGESGIHFDLFHINFNGLKVDKKVTLTIPKDVVLDNLKFDMAAGKVKMTDLTAKSVEYYVSAGKFEAKNLNVLEHTKLNMDAGSMELKDSSIKNASVEVNAGEMTIDGVVLGDTKAEVNAGAMKIETDVEESKYSFHTDVSFGEIKINGHSGDGIGSHSNAENKMDLECNAGSIKVKTR